MQTTVDTTKQTGMNKCKRPLFFVFITQYFISLYQPPSLGLYLARVPFSPVH